MIDRRTFLLTPLALTAAERKPNIVLIVAPGWRGQATPWAGDPDIDGLNVAPNLAKFAKDALVFPRAYSADPQPDPARTAIATGRYPHVTGVIREGAPLRTEEVTIDAVLKAGGYTASTAVESLKSPFFMNVTLTAPMEWKPVDAAKLHLRDNVPVVDAQKARQGLAKTYGLYSLLDDQLGKTLVALDRAGAAENTIVAFTSDCGAQIGSHGIEGDGVPFEESVRIPLAIRYPHVLAPAMSELIVSQVDLMPTLLGLCGEPAFEGIQGHDLSTLLTSQKGDRPESVYAEGKIGERDEWRMLVQGLDKLVVNESGEVSQLYNLATDPYELKNLAHDPGVQLKRDQLLATLRASRNRLLDFKRR